MDATIYDPAPDFKFVNNMSTPILIWAVAGNNSLDFQIYGTKDGRQISISTPAIFNYTDPPAPVYTQSSTMAPGTIRQVEKATKGCTASFNYRVLDALGKELEKDTFVSKYVPLPNSFLVGEGYVSPDATAPPAQ
jgi:vancomycin resistance protein YoaR